MTKTIERREFLKTLGAGAAALALPPLAGCGRKPLRKPNIIIILADDLGYGDTSLYDGWIKTPQLERVASEGLKFTDFHTNASVCSPTRAGLMTGRYQQRVGITNVIVGTREDTGLDPRELTIPRLLKDAGYKTGMFGKWHLGHQGKHNPVQHGFDEYSGYLTGGADYHYHEQSWYNGLEKSNEEGYTTHLITDHSVRFIEENKDAPFFLYVPHAAVHLPFQAPDDPPYDGPDGQAPWKLRDMKYWDYWTTERIRPIYRRMMQELDTGIGKIFDTIERCGIAEDTFVFFFSDNGAIGAASNDPFRGGKADLHEGGHRVPALAWWPGKIPAGGVTDEMTIAMDLLPTISDLTGVPLPETRKIDGSSLKNLLFEQAPLPERPLFWGYEDRGTAMRDGKWKFITSPRGKELYDLERDPGERTNLADLMPERTAAMDEAVKEWRREVHGPSS